MAKIKPVTGKRIESAQHNVSAFNVFNESTNSKQTTTTRAAVESVTKNSDLPRSGTVSIMEVPISIIQDRKVNKFIVGDIEELAKSIHEIGLQQSIVLRQNEEGEDGKITYSVSIGHRRLAAYRLLYKKYGKPYDYINAKVLSGKEEDLENRIYLESNSQTRKLTLFEAIANFNPEEMSFEDEKFKKEYLEYMNAIEGYKEKEDKFDINSLVNYLSYQAAEVYPGLEISRESIRKYLRLCLNASNSLKEEIFKNKITVKDALTYCVLSEEEQNKIAQASDPKKEYDDVLFERKRNKRNSQGNIKKDDTKVLRDILKDVNRFGDAILKQIKNANKLEQVPENKNKIKALDNLEKAINEFKERIK